MHYGIENEADEENEKIESARELLASSSQISALETVLYKVVEFYARATKEHESAMQWQARFATTTQQLAEIGKKIALTEAGFVKIEKKIASTEAGLAETVKLAIWKASKDTAEILSNSATVAVGDSMFHASQRFDKMLDDGQKQLEAYVVESKTFYMKLVITSVVSSLLTALAITALLIPTFKQQLLPLTNVQMEGLLVGNRLQQQWNFAPDKDKKRLREFLGEEAAYYLDNSNAHK